MSVKSDYKLDNGGIFKISFQLLHIHALLVATPGTGHMAQPGADQYESGIAIRNLPTTRVQRLISRFSLSM